MMAAEEEHEHRAQRDHDVAILSAVRAELPTGHHELPGIIRAIELLRVEPLLLVRRDAEQVTAATDHDAMRQRSLSQPMVLMLEAVLTDHYPVGEENTLRALLKRGLIAHVATDPNPNFHEQWWGLTPEGERALIDSPLISGETRRLVVEYGDSWIRASIGQHHSV